MRSVGTVLADHVALYGELGDRDRAALAELPASVHRAARHKDLFKRGDQPTHVVIVMEGMLQRYSIGADGKRQIHSFYLPGDTPSLEALNIDRVDNNLGAVVDSAVGLIAHDDIQRVIEERPAVRKLLWRETHVQAAIFREWLMRNSTKSAHASVAHLFCEVYVRSRATGLSEGDSFPFPITQEILSDAVGLTSVHVNRTLMLLREEGVIEWRGSSARHGLGQAGQYR